MKFLVESGDSSSFPQLSHLTLFSIAKSRAQDRSDEFSGTYVKKSPLSPFEMVIGRSPDKTPFQMITFSATYVTMQTDTDIDIYDSGQSAVVKNSQVS